MPSIDNYNSLVGALYKSNPEFFMYSPAFCRCEGQTYLYSKWSNKETISKLHYFTSPIRFLAKIIRDIILVICSESKSVMDILSKKIFVFSYFDGRNDNNGILREEYFREILNDNIEIHCFYKLVNPGLFKRGVKYLRLISNLRKKFNCYAEYSFITPVMIIKALYLTFKHFFEFSQYKYSNVQDNILVSLLNTMHFIEILNGTVYSVYLQKLLFEKLLSRHPKIILSVWENQPWERVLESTKKRISPTTITKGFQHTGFSKKLLQHYPSYAERGLDSSPDFILTNGDINRDELVNKSNINSEIIVGGALRQNGIINQKLHDIAALVPRRTLNIAYAFSWDSSCYEDILEDLNELPPNINVYLKFHPDYPDWLAKCDFPKRFINSRDSWSEIGSKCSVVLANDNSLMFEGFFYGMHTVVYDGVNPYGLEKRDFDSPIVHITKSDLSVMLSEEIIERINHSTQTVIQSGYLKKYFVQRSLHDLKQIFFNV